MKHLNSIFGLHIRVLILFVRDLPRACGYAIRK